MSFNDRETSLANGQPIRLYEFIYGSAHWRYTNADLAVTYDKKIFDSLPGIEDDGFFDTGNLSEQDVTIKFPENAGLFDIYKRYPPARAVNVTIYDSHIGEVDAWVQFVGEIGEVIRKSNYVETLCVPLGASKQTGLRLYWGKNCPHAVYDSQCKVDKNAHKKSGVIAFAEPFTVTATVFSEFEEHSLAGGFIEWENQYGFTEASGIQSHEGDTITVSRWSDRLQKGLEITAYRGCSGTVSVCGAVFNNIDHFGGVPGLPGKSPFDGNPVF